MLYHELSQRKKIQTLCLGKVHRHIRDSQMASKQGANFINNQRGTLNQAHRMVLPHC